MMSAITFRQPATLKTIFPVFKSVNTLSFFSTHTRQFDQNKLEANKKIASEVHQYVREKITQAVTWGVSSPLTQKKVSAFLEVDKKVKEMRRLRAKLFNNQPEENRNTFVAFALSAHLARTYGCGNCGEMAALGLMRLSEIGWEGRAGIFEVARPPQAPLPKHIEHALTRVHNFLVIGLNTNQQEPSLNLGENAIVCDPYSSQTPYPTSEMPKYLQNYYGIHPETLHPILANFDPHIETISLLCCNVFSSEEFASPFQSHPILLLKSTPIASLLQTFHMSTSNKDKLIQADLILKEIPALLKNLKTCTTQSLAEMSNQKDHILTLRSQLERLKNPYKNSFVLD